MVRMGPPGGGGSGSSDNSQSDNDDDSSKSSGGSSSSGNGIIGSPGPRERERARREREDETSGGSDTSTDSDPSPDDSVGSPGPQERREARQEAEEQMENDSSPDETVGSPGPRERERVRREREQDDAVQEVSEAVEEELGGDVQRGRDYTVEQNEFGGHSPSARQRQRARQLRQAGLEEQATEYIEQSTARRTVTSVELTDEYRQRRAGEQLESQLDEEYGVDAEAGEDFTVEETDDGAFRANLDEELEDEIAQSQQPGRRDDDIFTDVVAGTEDALSEVAQVASGDESTRVEFRGEGSVVNVARQENPDLTADLGAVSDAGDRMSEAGETIQEDYIQPGAQAAGSTVGLGVDLVTTGTLDTRQAKASLSDVGEIGASIAGEEQLESEFEETGAQARQSKRVEVAGEFGTGIASGGASILNAPAIGGTVVDAAEFTVEGGRRTAAGEGGEFAQEAGGQAAVAGAAGAQAAVDNPARVTGQVVGGLATSSGAIKGAQAVGGARAGRAAAVGIQPGEELALAAARRGVPGTRRVANVVSDTTVRGRGGGDSDVDLETTDPMLPDDRPVGMTATDVDEAMGVSGPSRRSRLRGRVRRGIESARERVPDVDMGERGQAQMVPRERGRSETDPSISDDRVTANLYQQSVSRQLEETRSTLEGGGYEGDIDPVGTGRRDLTRRERRMREEAMEPEVTRTDSRFELGEGLRTAIRTEVETGAGERSVTGQESGALEDTGIEADLATGQETRLDTRQDSRQETGTETRSETRTETSLEPVSEVRSESRSETRLETRQETDVDRERILDDDELNVEATGGETGTKEIEYGVADPEDVLSGDVFDDGQTSL